MNDEVLNKERSLFVGWFGFTLSLSGDSGGTYPGTKSKSTALRAICVAAFCTSGGRPRLEQNLD